MKKINIIFIMIILGLTIPLVDSNGASDDYKTFNEIILSTGKLLCYFTDEEMEEYKSKLDKKFIGVDVYVVNKNVEATYISETLYNVYNSGGTNVEYQLDIEVTKSEKTTWEVTGDLSATAKGTIKMFQTTIESKVGVKYKNEKSTTTKEIDRTEL